jgi:hypothetical protein
MQNATDKWIMALPEGRNEKCPCRCGLKMKKVALDPEPHFKKFEQNIKEQKQ